MSGNGEKPLRITETALRDGQQSLLASRLQRGEMLEACTALERVGYWAIEVWGGASFDACLRFLHEDPWDRLRALRRALPHSRLSMLLRGQSLVGYRHYADDVVRAFIRRAADNGIDLFRCFDALNDSRNLATAISAVLESGRHAQGALCYTTGPGYDLDYYMKLGRELAALGCHSLAIKDMAGLLTPYRAAELVTALQADTNLPVHLHSHATTGLAAMNHLKAVEAGCRHLDTALSPLAGGNSHPATESITAAFADTPYATALNIEAMAEAAEILRRARARHAEMESPLRGIDARVLHAQVPGGMIASLAQQLRENRALERLDEVMAEIPRVRAELGHPPLVTPSAQLVATQAVLNVLSGQRYATLTDQVRRYLLGHYGRPPSPPDEPLLARALLDGEAISDRPADHIAPELGGDESEAHLNEVLLPEAWAIYQRGGDALSEPMAIQPIDEPGVVSAPLSGLVLAVQVSEGDRVCPGTPLLLLEAMKMQSHIPAPSAGIIERIHTAAGAEVQRGEPLITIKPLES